MFTVQRYDFFKNQVIYGSVFKGNYYCSFHERTGMSDEQAKKAFHREHNAEVEHLIRKKLQDEALQQA